MPAISRAIVLQSINSAGGVSASRAGLAATVEVANGKEQWSVTSGRGVIPKAGDRIIPIATPKDDDKTPRVVAAVAEVEGKYQLTCDVPGGE